MLTIVDYGVGIWLLSEHVEKGGVDSLILPMRCNPGSR